MNTARWYIMWAKYFAQESNCYSRKIGAVLVNDGEIIGIGHNGPPSEIGDCSNHGVIDGWLDFNTNKNDTVENGCIRKRLGIKRSGEAMQYCLAHHAEQNAIVYAARYGRKTNGATLYLTCGVPCIECCKAIINAGIKTIYCSGDKETLKSERESLYNFEFAKKMLKAAKIKVCRIDSV